MEATIEHLEQSMQEADGKINQIVWKMDAVQKGFQDSENEICEITVTRLLHSVTQVKEEYQTLRQDILEVQQLQKQLSDSLKLQLSQVHSRYHTLRSEVFGKSKAPQLKQG